MKLDQHVDTCRFCHLPTAEAVMKLMSLLGARQEPAACGPCFERMGDETTRLLKHRSAA